MKKLSVVVPTYNEAGNVPRLVLAIAEVLEEIPHEIIVVDDDSPDETWRVARELARERDDLQVIRRKGRRGLSSAVVDGFRAASGDVLAVMDADGQHDASLLPALYRGVAAGADVAVGSRYVEGGSVGEWDERRYALSRLATALAIRLCRVEVADPMSGYFAIDRAAFEEVLPRLEPRGFKILLELLVKVPPTTEVVELPLVFGHRHAGESKLSRRVQLEFVEHLYQASLGRWIPLTFVKYCIVGSLGVGVHMGAYWTISRVLLAGDELTLAGFSLAVAGAIETAIVFNFLVNNVWTFALERLRGHAAVLGFVKFNVACGVGAVANYATSAYLFERGWPDLLCALLGAFVGTIWNYTVNRLVTWRR